jgi:hypothetical protein
VVLRKAARGTVADRLLTVSTCRLVVLVPSPRLAAAFRLGELDYTWTAGVVEPLARIDTC